jgi:hypothetical protein
MQASGSSPQDGRFIEARPQGVIRAAGLRETQLEKFAGGREPAIGILLSEGSFSPQGTSPWRIGQEYASYSRQETS